MQFRDQLAQSRPLPLPHEGVRVDGRRKDRQEVPDLPRFRGPMRPGAVPRRGGDGGFPNPLLAEDFLDPAAKSRLLDPVALGFHHGTNVGTVPRAMKDVHAFPAPSRYVQGPAVHGPDVFPVQHEAARAGIEAAHDQGLSPIRPAVGGQEAGVRGAVGGEVQDVAQSDTR